MDDGKLRLGIITSIYFVRNTLLNDKWSVTIYIISWIF